MMIRELIVYTYTYENSKKLIVHHHQKEEETCLYFQLFILSTPVATSSPPSSVSQSYFHFKKMKIKVEFLNGNEHRPSNHQSCQSVSHIFDGDTAVKDHIKVLLTHFKIPIEKVNSYALQNPLSLQYIEDAFLTPERLVEAERGGFILRMRPQAIAQRVIENLKSNSPESPTTKDIIFNIRYQLKDVEYVEEFISKGGINILLDIITKSHGNTQSYALTALRCFMGYHSGLDEVMSRPQLIDRLYSLTASTVLASVCRQSLELLFVVCNFDGYSLVHRAAKNAAVADQSLPYQSLISLLTSGDMETQLNTLTLLNCLLENAPNPRKVRKLLSGWKALGIVKILKAQDHVTHSDFKTQLARFQTMAGIGLDGNRRRNELTRQHSQQDLEMILLHYQEQQPLIKLLSNELRFLRNAVKSAIENGSYINYRAPTERYDEYILRKNEIIGEGPINISFLKRSDKFTSAFRKSMYVRSPNTSVLFDQTTLEEADDDDEDDIEIKSPSKLGVGSATRDGIAMLSPISSSKTPTSPHSPTTTSGAIPMALQLPTISEQTNNSSQPSTPTATSTPTAALPFSTSTPTNSASNLSNISTSAALPPLGTTPQQQQQLPLSSTPTPTTSTPLAKPITSNGTFNLFDVTNSSSISSSTTTTANTNSPQPTTKKSRQPTKPVIAPKKRMKPLYWNRYIIHGSRKTIWDGLPQVSFDEDQFMDLFSLYTEKLIAVGSSPSVPGKKPVQKVVSLLSQKRSNTISIMCSKLPSDENLIRAIREMDTTKLTLEQVTSLYNNIPTPEEMAAIQELSDDVVLDKPERWCLMIDGFPKVKQRLKTWEFMLKFDSMFKAVYDSMMTISNASNEIRESESVAYLFSILLSLGNYLNGGNQFRGQADGFNLDVVYKILEIKDNHGGGSLMDFAIKMLITNFPKFANLPLEIPSVPSASLLNLVDVANQLNKLVDQFDQLCTDVNDIVNTTDSEDPYIIIVPKFMNHAYTSLRSVRAHIVETAKLFNELVEFFMPNISSNPMALPVSPITTSPSNSNNNIVQPINQPSSSSSTQPINNNQSSANTTPLLNNSGNTVSNTTNNNNNNNNQLYKYSTEKFFTVFSTIITAFKKSPSKRLSQKGFGLKISDSEDPMATIIESLKKNTNIEVNRR
ncbi:actin binding protein [Cavenderia fasciculata]|uniref:Actin binding protein n=1 Tax=Cavenderia fasciculata TaxID=261658 RepID=F4Q5V5_CACFS|nr:actin binding protein [Cavenderia fasciculata]EGG17364.1 actin binding protein [Cavenderia fasciculata]|eukprot:XP_004355848.1 actin binding protein [Cavenderia fasciculata]